MSCLASIRATSRLVKIAAADGDQDAAGEGGHREAVRPLLVLEEAPQGRDEEEEEDDGDPSGEVTQQVGAVVGVVVLITCGPVSWTSGVLGVAKVTASRTAKTIPVSGARRRSESGMAVLLGLVDRASRPLSVPAL